MIGCEVVVLAGHRRRGDEDLDGVGVEEDRSITLADVLMLVQRHALVIHRAAEVERIIVVGEPARGRVELPRELLILVVLVVFEGRERHGGRPSGIIQTAID
jgi:hypothetical protein